MPGLHYASCGVDISRANRFLDSVKGLIKRTGSPLVVGEVGTFGGLFRLDSRRFNKPVLAASCDGVGTKLKLAFSFNRHRGVGIDLVAMNVNDILCLGAEPLFFLDYIACDRIEPHKLKAVMQGITEGCRQAGCSLIGGETAEMPGMYAKGEYDLAGFVVGVAEEKRIIDGSRIRQGDAVLGLASAGLHSNGFSLARRALSLRQQKAFKEELLRPTRIYVKPILSVLQAAGNRQQGVIKGIAHITGGAFYEKAPRPLPKGLRLRIRKGSWPVPRIFQLIQAGGNVDDREMYRTFNMGVGMILIMKPRYIKAIQKKLASYKIKSWVIGEVVKGEKGTELI